MATDAVGMGLNLNIRRVIFYSMNKLIINENGEREMVPISVSQALQIAGRAGRFNTQWSTGYVTTFHEDEVMVGLGMTAMKLALFLKKKVPFFTSPGYERNSVQNSRRNLSSRPSPNI